MDRERERRRWEQDELRGRAEEDAAQARRDERVEVRRRRQGSMSWSGFRVKCSGLGGWCGTAVSG